jgi:membrane protease YdiL (CAAX protease family)
MDSDRILHRQSKKPLLINFSRGFFNATNLPVQKSIQILILIGCFLVTILALISANKIEGLFPGHRSLAAVGTGIIFGILLYVVIRRIQNLYSIEAPSLSYRKSLIGLLFAVLAFIPSLLLTGVSVQSSSALLMSDIWNQLLFQVRPVLIEEIGFRLGTVWFAIMFFGRKSALIAGSVPFGVLHLLHFFSGEPLFWEYILGTAVAGLFLTLLFLRHGLAAAILAHYSWNLSASLSSKFFQVPQESIEGGHGTLVILTTICMWLLFRNKNYEKSV